MLEWLGNETWLAWGIGLLIGFPFLMILFGEMLYRIEGHQNNRQAFLANAQYFVLPSLVIYLLLNYVVGLDHDVILIKIIASIFWISLIYLVVSSFNLFWQGQAKNDDSWQSRVPTLVLNIARLFFILLGVALVVSSIWEVDLGQMLAALGVGSIVLGLALQDTLGSLFAGITLISARQFQVGDWLKTGEVTGQVTAINWHSVTLRTFEDDSLVIPNSMLARDTFYNLSRPSKIHMERITIKFSEDHPPNQVRSALLEAAKSTPGVLATPPPKILIKELADDAGAYQALLYFDDYADYDAIYDAYLTRAWYAAKRHGIVFPFEDYLQYQAPASEMDHGIDDSIDKKQLIDKLLELSSFSLSRDELERLTDAALVQRFGKGEQFITINQECEGLYVILTGKVRKLTYDHQGKERNVGSAYPGELVGLVSMIRHDESKINAYAAEDTQLAILQSNAVESVLQTNPQFVLTLESGIDTRLKSLQAIQQKGQDKSRTSVVKNGDISLKEVLQKK
ncbi:MAG: mechanosensitive ion channel family protein [Thiotrichaceae bacterium]